MITKALSFWQFLNIYKIEIPIIQRDYAQGRKGREKLRQSFLENIKTALDGKKNIKLDFVYGSEKQGVLYPLDGQQRLTTLWLLHWYTALLSGKLEEAACVLAKFTYETRVSSREFCHQLCNPSNFESFKKEKDIVDYIQSRTWYYSEWDQDPTIQAMLRMLSGTNVKDKGVDFIDGLQELYSGQENILDYWETLTGENCPIVFYHLPLRDFGLSDDLYIKMNARGKQLTPFENFKADFIGHIKNEELLKNISKWIDINWTDYFWTKKSKGVLSKDNKVVASNRVDEIFYAFINRFMWCEQVLFPESSSFTYFDADNYDSYSDFTPYKFVSDETLNSLSAVLNNLIEYEKEGKTLPVCPWKDDFRFVPEYIKDDKGYNVPLQSETSSGYLRITTLNQVERVVFYALCKYFKDGPGDYESLERWMRVVWNLVSGIDKEDNHHIRSIEAIRTAVEFIEGLSSREVYKSLVAFDKIDYTTAFGKRCKEEREKAEQLLNNPESGWEDLIKDATRIKFLRGSLSCLYYDETQICWDNFNEKLARAKKYFSGTEVDINVFKRFFSKFTPQNFNEDTIWWRHKTFKPTNGVWLYYLNHELLREPVHHFMIDEDNFPVVAHKGDTEESLILYYLSVTNLLDVINKHIPDSWLRITHDYKSLYYRSQGVFLTAGGRDSLLIDNPEVTISDEIKIKETKTGNTCLLYGFDVKFSYKGRNFCWDRDGYIYMMASDNADVKLKKDLSESEGQDLYYRIKPVNMNKAGFVSDLKSLIAQYDNREL